MTIAYQQGLEDLADQLTEMGYNMVVWGNNSAEYVHALIYDSKQHGELFMHLQNCTNEPEGGAIVFNVSGMNAKEVDNLLKTKIYSPLF